MSQLRVGEHVYYVGNIPRLANRLFVIESTHTCPETGVNLYRLGGLRGYGSFTGDCLRSALRFSNETPFQISMPVIYNGEARNGFERGGVYRISNLSEPEGLRLRHPRIGSGIPVNSTEISLLPPLGRGARIRFKEAVLRSLGAATSACPYVSGQEYTVSRTAVDGRYVCTEEHDYYYDVDAFEVLSVPAAPQTAMELNPTVNIRREVRETDWAVMSEAIQSVRAMDWAADAARMRATIPTRARASQPVQESNTPSDQVYGVHYS